MLFESKVACILLNILGGYSYIPYIHVEVFCFFLNCYSFATVLILHFLIFPKTQYISEFSIIFLIINHSDFLLTYI